MMSLSHISLMIRLTEGYSSIYPSIYLYIGLIFANLLYKAQVTGYMLFNAETKVHNLLASPTSMEPPQPQNLLPTNGGEEADAFMKLDGTIKIVGEVSE